FSRQDFAERRRDLQAPAAVDRGNASTDGPDPVRRVAAARPSARTRLNRPPIRIRRRWLSQPVPLYVLDPVYERAAAEPNVGRPALNPVEEAHDGPDSARPPIDFSLGIPLHRR